MEITSGIHLIDNIKGCSCYLVLNTAHMLLIDTGMPHNEKKIIKYIQKLGRNPSDLKYIFLTHADIDHMGSTAALKRTTGAKIGIHSDDAAVLSGKANLKKVDGFLGFV